MIFAVSNCLVAGATLHQLFSKQQAQNDFDTVRTIIDRFIC